MFAAIAQVFAAITMFFKAFENFASATNHISEWGNEAAGAFADEARIQRQAKLNQLNKDLKASSAK